MIWNRNMVLRSLRNHLSTGLSSLCRFQFSFMKDQKSLNADTRKFAVIGSGPAGFYATKMLTTKYGDGVSVDIYDKLPHPFGLVRTGIAPDHQNMKNVQKDFLTVLDYPNVNMLCNVEITDDCELQDVKDLNNPNSSIKINIQRLMKSYSGIILCCGAEGEATLGLENEVNPNVIFSRQFVNWYNGSIESSLHSELNKIDFAKIKNVAIIGNGNVALDIFRILAQKHDYLSKLDIPQHVLHILQNKAIENVHIIGRRGAVQSAFSTKEIRETSKITQIYTIKEEIEESLNAQTQEELNTNNAAERRLLTRKLDFIKSLPQISQKDMLETVNSKSDQPRLFLRYLLSPTSVAVRSNSELRGINVIPNKLVGPPFKQNSEIDSTKPAELIEADLIVYSIGYKPKKLFSSLFSYGKNGLIQNQKGFIEHESNKIFTSGWMKRGARGILDETLHDSQETFITISKQLSNLDSVQSIYSKDNSKYDIDNQSYKLNYEKLFGVPQDILSNKIIQKEEIKRILKYEEDEGKRMLKLSEKICSRAEMLRIAKVE